MEVRRRLESAGFSVTCLTQGEHLAMVQELQVFRYSIYVFQNMGLYYIKYSTKKEQCIPTSGKVFSVRFTEMSYGN